jgi:hypothetical protein
MANKGYFMIPGTVGYTEDLNIMHENSHREIRQMLQVAIDEKCAGPRSCIE